jgi:hypothetical protein
VATSIFSTPVPFTLAVAVDVFVDVALNTTVLFEDNEKLGAVITFAFAVPPSVPEYTVLGEQINPASIEFPEESHEEQFPDVSVPVVVTKLVVLPDFNALDGKTPGPPPIIGNPAVNAEEDEIVVDPVNPRIPPLVPLARPVPPYTTGISAAFHIPDVIVPRVVMFP